MNTKSCMPWRLYKRVNNMKAILYSFLHFSFILYILFASVPMPGGDRSQEWANASNARCLATIFWRNGSTCRVFPPATPTRGRIRPGLWYCLKFSGSSSQPLLLWQVLDDDRPRSDDIVMYRIGWWMGETFITAIVHFAGVGAKLSTSSPFEVHV